MTEEFKKYVDMLAIGAIAEKVLIDFVKSVRESMGTGWAAAYVERFKENLGKALKDESEVEE